MLQLQASFASVQASFAAAALHDRKRRAIDLNILQAYRVEYTQ